MSGMDRVTGKALDGIEHLRQSIADILGTPQGTRVMRRIYGSLWPELIDQPDNGATRVRLFAATAGALMKWEPRLRLSRVQIFSTATPGQVVLDLQGIYSPPGQRRSVLSMRVPVQVGAAA
ncbi:baseplate assembly protein [Variovorax paradoxus]|uniref:Baseplate assembly protein n=1 Tax=Variovorax paradoxus TaxID=34073 RepID=A0AA91I7L1_VARPD|nr:baseplate assembly protein [Variovorax paradoxus]